MLSMSVMLVTIAPSSITSVTDRSNKKLARKIFSFLKYLRSQHAHTLRFLARPLGNRNDNNSNDNGFRDLNRVSEIWE